MLTDSITALGLVIAFYYGLTGFACVIYYRREIFRSVGNFISMGVLPAAGGTIMFMLLIKACFAPGEATTSRLSIFGVGGPVIIAAASIMTGFLLMLFAQHGMPDFSAASRRCSRVTGASHVPDGVVIVPRRDQMIAEIM